MSPAPRTKLEAANPTRWPERQADEETTAIDRAQGELGRFAKGHRLRASELVRRAGFRDAGDRRGGRLPNVADIDRLQARLAATEQGQNR